MTSKPCPSRATHVIAAAGAVCATATVVLHLLIHPLVALGFAGGVLTGAGMLSALVVVLNRVVVPPQQQRGLRWPWMLLHTAKFAAAAGIMFLVVVLLEAHAGAFAAGYAVALIALLIAVGVGSSPKAGGSPQD